MARTGGQTTAVRTAGAPAATGMPSERETLRWIVSVAGDAVGKTILYLVVQVVLGASLALNALLLRDLVDSAVAQDPNGLIIAAVELALLIAAQIAMRAVNRFLNEHTRSLMENRFKSRLFGVLMSGEYARVKRLHTGEWMNRLTSDTAVVADAFTQVVPGFGGTLAKLIAAMAVLIAIEPVFGIAVLIGGLIAVVVTWYFRRILKTLHKAIQEADGKTRSFMQERLESLLVIRSFARERQTLEEAGLLMADHRAARMKRNRFSNMCNVLYGVVMRGAYVIAAIWCAWSIFSGTMSYGTFVAVLQLVSQVQAPFSDVSGYIPRYYAMIASAERLMEFEGISDEALLDEQKPVDVSGFAAFGLQDVAFSYDRESDSALGSSEPAPGELGNAGIDRSMQPAVIQDFFLRIKRGDYVAFTGPSGCGKSTALALLMCLYPTDSGARYYEDAAGQHDLSDYARDLFAYVPQGNVLMSGTIREVVSFGDSTGMHDDARIRAALHTACADEFVDELDCGLETRLGEHGAGLSEGQVQRLSIARALFSDRPVLLLDECTSALDEATEERLLRNLRALTDKTVIIVTHRPAALDVVDSVVRFSEEGVRIV